MEDLGSLFLADVSSGGAAGAGCTLLPGHQMMVFKEQILVVGK